VTLNSSDRFSHASKGHDSTPYNNTGKHLARSKFRAISLEENRSTLLKIALKEFKQEAQLSQRDRATLVVIEYFAKSLKLTQGHSKRHC